MPISRKKTDIIRRGILIALASLIPAVYAAAFLGMAWIRSQQGHGQVTLKSTIEGLAIRGAPADPLADVRARGEEVYRHYCQICHGEKGHGDGTNASFLQTPPRDFSRPEFWDTQTTEERVLYAVSKGGPEIGKSVLMPAWGRTLTDNQIRDVIVYIRAFVAEPEAKQ